MANHSAADILSQVKDVARNKYAWPGGYPMHIVMSDGESLCADCAKSEFRLICQSTLSNIRDGWRAEGSDINWEDSDLYCAHCNNRIESAYAEEES
jgi:hypothetical protein